MLSIGSGAVEWVERAALSSAESHPNSPEDLAQAAHFAAGVEQLGELRCVLVLPEERFAVAVHSLPGLGEDELRTVLLRKAAQDLVRTSATPCTRPCPWALPRISRTAADSACGRSGVRRCTT